MTCYFSLFDKQISELSYLEVQELFNLVAPIHIYLSADMTNFDFASKQFVLLKKHSTVGSFFSPHDDERSILSNIDPRLIQSLYNGLIIRIVFEECPSLLYFKNESGAYSFHNSLLSGDDDETFEYHLNYVLLLEKILDYKEFPVS